MKTILISVFLLSLSYGMAADERKVANYSLGKSGTKAYEHFSFWVGGEKGSEIEYSYGKDGKEIKLEFLGTEAFRGEKAIKVQFPNGLVLFIIPKGLTLKVTDGDKYVKTFEWEYEGPLDGRGTFCTPCAEDEKEAMTFIKKYFLNLVVKSLSNGNQRARLTIRRLL